MAGVTWVTLSLTVIRNQHGNEEGPFSLRIHSTLRMADAACYLAGGVSLN